MQNKYIVLYVKIVDDKEMGALMTGIFIGGVCDTEEEADALATKCVSETQGGIIIPKVSLMRTANLIEVVDELNTHFSKMADTMYENEKIMAKNVVNAKNAKDAKAKRKEERLSQL
jgi:hypothetical protein